MNRIRSKPEILLQHFLPIDLFTLLQIVLEFPFQLRAVLEVAAAPSMTCFTNFCSIFSSTIYCFLKVNPSTYKKWVSPSLVSNVQHIRLCQFENKRGRRFCCITAPCSWSRICSARKYCLSDCQFKPFKCTEHKENISSKKSIQKTDHCAYWAHFGRHLEVMILKMETICVFASKKWTYRYISQKCFVHVKAFTTTKMTA